MPTNEPTLRTRVEGVSRPILIWLTQLPRPVVMLGTVALVAVGLFAPILLALAALVIVFLFVAWIGYLSWPVLSVGGKAARIVMLALVCALAFLRF